MGPGQSYDGKEDEHQGIDCDGDETVFVPAESEVEVEKSLLAGSDGEKQIRQDRYAQKLDQEDHRGTHGPEQHVDGTCGIDDAGHDVVHPAILS